MWSSESSPRRMAVFVIGALGTLSMTKAMSVDDAASEIRSRQTRSSWVETWLSPHKQAEFMALAGYFFHTGPPVPIRVPQCDMEKEDCSMEMIKNNTNTAVFPGGNTECLDSTTPYYFQVMPGTGEGLLIYFAGGGACWQSEINQFGSCIGSKVMASVSPNVIQAPYHGVFDKKHPHNPYADYTIINIGYCSGDVHVGDVTRFYDVGSGAAPVRVRQAGMDNTMATLEWVRKNIPEPENIVVMGCSAGSLGAQLWGGYISDMYADNCIPPAISVVADSYLGIFPASQTKLFNDLQISHAPFTHVLPAPLFDKIKNGTAYLCEITEALRQMYPDISYLFIQSKADIVQAVFYDAIALTIGNGPKLTKDNAPQCVISSMPGPKKVETTMSIYPSMVGLFKSFPEPNNSASYFLNSMYHCFTCFDRFYSTYIVAHNNISKQDESITLISWLEQATLPKAGVEANLTAKCEIAPYHVGGDWMSSLMYGVSTFNCPA